MNDTLYRRTKSLGLDPRHVAEVGVFLPESSNVLGFIEDGCRVDLIEPDPLCVERIRERFDRHSNVTVFPNAMFTERKTLGLYRTNSSTFVEGMTSSPALVNDRYQPNENDLFHVESLLFSDIDDGTINLLSIDTEGCEWYVLQHMTSRPDVISIETHGKHYRNPYLREIREWMGREGYHVWYSDRSDTVFLRRGIGGFFTRWRAWFRR